MSKKKRIFKISLVVKKFNYFNSEIKKEEKREKGVIYIIEEKGRKLEIVFRYKKKKEGLKYH